MKWIDVFRPEFAGGGGGLLVNCVLYMLGLAYLISFCSGLH
jgi:hypothetical protein